MKNGKKYQNGSLWICACRRKKEQPIFQVKSATSSPLLDYQAHSSKYKNCLWQKILTHLGCQGKVANNRRLQKRITWQPILGCYHANLTVTDFVWTIIRKRRLEEENPSYFCMAYLYMRDAPYMFIFTI